MDNLLIYLVQSFNREALNLLVEKYRKYISYWINEEIKLMKFSKEIDKEILYSDIEMLIYRTIESYNQDKGVFYSYLRGATKNIIRNHLRQNKKQNLDISLEMDINEDSVLLDYLSSNANLSLISERYSLIEEMEELFDKLKIFKDNEKKIICYKMQGYTIEEIAKLNDTSVRKVNYLIKKVRNM